MDREIIQKMMDYGFFDNYIEPNGLNITKYAVELVGYKYEIVHDYCDILTLLLKSNDVIFSIDLVNSEGDITDSIIEFVESTNSFVMKNYGIIEIVVDDLFNYSFVCNNDREFVTEDFTILIRNNVFCMNSKE